MVFLGFLDFVVLVALKSRRKESCDFQDDTWVRSAIGNAYECSEMLSKKNMPGMVDNGIDQQLEVAITELLKEVGY